MGLFDFISGEFIDVIEWIDNTQTTMVWKFQRHDNAIKNGAQMTVRPGQLACFINEGNMVADLFQPGRHTLATQNMPIMTTLNSWKHGFNSPFKADVFFFSMKEFIDNGWGVKEPIMYTDPKYGVEVEVRGFGTYAFQFKDPKLFLEKFNGTNGNYDTENLQNQFRSMIVYEFTDKINEAGIPVNKLAGNVKEISEILQPMINESIEKKYGITITQFYIESLSLTDEDKRRIKMISEKMVLGDSNTFVQQDLLDTMKINAKQGGGNPGSDMMTMMMGMNMMNNMNNQNQNQNQQQNKMNNNMAPPPLSSFYVAVNGQQTGPFDIQTLAQMAANGQFNAQSMVWKQGMAAWAAAGQVNELAQVFQSNTPPPPPPPIG